MKLTQIISNALDLTQTAGAKFYDAVTYVGGTAKKVVEISNESAEQRKKARTYKHLDQLAKDAGMHPFGYAVNEMTKGLKETLERISPSEPESPTIEEIILHRILSEIFGTRAS